MKFEIVGEITGIETIGAGNSIRVLPLSNMKIRKRTLAQEKGIATVKLIDETFRLAEMFCPLQVPPIVARTLMSVSKQG